MGQTKVEIEKESEVKDETKAGLIGHSHTVGMVIWRQYLLH